MELLPSFSKYFTEPVLAKKQEPQTSRVIVHTNATRQYKLNSHQYESHHISESLTGILNLFRQYHVTVLFTCWIFSDGFNARLIEQKPENHSEIVIEEPRAKESESNLLPINTHTRTHTRRNSKSPKTNPSS